MNNKEILNYYEKQIENYDKLSYNDALSLLYIAKKDNDKELLDYIFNGTLHSVLNYIKISKFDLLNSADYDLGDIINTAFEVWYKKITSFELLNYDTLSKALGIKFSNDIISIITESDAGLTSLYNITEFNRLIKTYIEMRNESTNVDIDELMNNAFPNMHISYYLCIHIENMVKILEKIYLRLSNNDKNKVDINILSISKLNKLLLKLGLFDLVDLNYIDENNVEDNILKEDLEKRVFEVLKTLTKRENEILKLRFGFEDKPKLLEEVGKIYGLSRNRIRQIECKALRKLRHPSRSKKIKDYGRYV